MPRCPNGHSSDAADFCSTCGAEIGGPAAVVPAAAACPVCTTPLDVPRQSVCGVCGYDLRAGPAGVVRPPHLVPAAARWDVVVRVDPTLYGEPDPAAPTDALPPTFTLFDAEAVTG